MSLKGYVIRSLLRISGESPHPAGQAGISEETRTPVSVPGTAELEPSLRALEQSPWNHGMPSLPPAQKLFLNR